MIKRKKLTKNLYLKEVDVNDVNYILKLRTDKYLSKYLNHTPNNKKKQLEWLNEYFKRRKKKDEFYFIFQIKKDSFYKSLGFARIIKIDNRTFHYGGWILQKNTQPWIALECCLSIYEYSFNYLNYKKCLLWINLKNLDVIKYHKSLGAKYVKKDKKEIYLSFNQKNYIKLKKKFKFYY